jgi:hypothetical protein
MILTGGINPEDELVVPQLKIQLDDPQLYDNTSLFIQIVTKHYAVERFHCYNEVKKLLSDKNIS